MLRYIGFHLNSNVSERLSLFMTAQMRFSFHASKETSAIKRLDSLFNTNISYKMYNYFYTLYPIYIYIYNLSSKFVDRSRGWPESSLFNSYYTEV